MKSPRTFHRRIEQTMETNDKSNDKKCVNRKELTKTLSILPNVPERVIYKYSLVKRDNESLGITIVGGNDHLLNGIFIKTISKNSACSLDGNLLVGDQILMLNEYNLRDVTHEQAVNYFRLCTSRIDIVISRMLESKTTQNGDRSVSPFHGRVLYHGQSLSDEPFVLEHKGIDN